ncbi:MAG: hypothetical protein M3430_02735 [Acidobacteriota bacterium]|nr:hypothetical protein [Acidobacteriota bacterium]
MRVTRRRSRTLDLLTSADALRDICDRLRERLPELIPKTEKELLRFLYAVRVVRHVERRPVTDPRRGRPGRWRREDLLKAASVLRSILERETGGRISLSSVIGQYLPVIHFPSDVADALSSRQINLQEAAQLARLTADRLGCSAQGARARRRELLQSHLAVRGSQPRLRARVGEILGEVPSAEITSGQITAVFERIEAGDLDDELMSDFLQAMDGVSNVPYRLEKRRKERHKQQGTDPVQPLQSHYRKCPE